MGIFAQQKTVAKDANISICEKAERKKEMSSEWQENTNQAPFYPTSYFPDFPLSGA